MMKTLFSSCLAAVILASSPSLIAQESVSRMLFKDLPEPVKTTARDQRDGKEIKRIEKVTRANVDPLYKITIAQGRGDDKVVYIAADGALRSDSASIASGNIDKVNNLPQAVRTTFRNQSPNGTITDVDVETRGGRTVYEIEYTEAGQASELVIHENGSLVNRRSLQRTRNIYDDARTSSESASTTSESPQGFDRPLAATRKIEFDELPQAVKETARREAKSNRIEDVERGTLDGRVIFEIAFKRDGQHNELRVAEDGSIVRGIAGSDIRLPGVISQQEVPEAVRRAIREQVGSGEVNDIDKMTVDGKTVYEVGFKRQKGGPQQEVQIAEDGQIIREAAGSEN